MNSFHSHIICVIVFFFVSLFSIMISQNISCLTTRKIYMCYVSHFELPCNVGICKCEIVYVMWMKILKFLDRYTSAVKRNFKFIYEILKCSYFCVSLLLSLTLLLYTLKLIEIMYLHVKSDWKRVMFKEYIKEYCEAKLGYYSFLKTCESIKVLFFKEMCEK